MKLTYTKRGPSGCFLPCKRSRRFLFVFSRTDGWWDKYFPGYTHVSLCEVVEGFLIVHDPSLGDCRTIFRSMPAKHEWDNYKIIEVVVTPTKRNRLIRPLFQTCTTLVQYLAGIDLGAILAQTLYERLIDPTTAQTKDGIREIKTWEWKPQ